MRPSGRFSRALRKTERITVRRVLAFVLLCSSVALLGATPAPAPERPALPIVVVFPFQTSSDLRNDTGGRAAQLFVQQMNGAGGIDAVLAPASVARTNYLKYTRGLLGDYYLTGYMTPLGNGVSLVEQLVSAQSGAIVYGTTAQIDSFDDASAQAIQVHGAIVAMEQQDAERYASDQTESTPAPAPTNEANLSKGFSDLAGLFKHHSAATPAPAAIRKPAKGIFVVRAGGSVPESNLAQATSTMYAGLQNYFNARMTNASSRNVSAEADQICGTSRDNTVASGSLAATTQRHGLGTRTQWTFTLDVYTCFGALLAHSEGAGDSLDSAVKAAVQAYATAHPQNG